MALPIAAPERKLKHTRKIDVRIYARGNGLWEVDARVRDERTETAMLASGPRIAGEPIHDMLLRLVIDEGFQILEAGAESNAVPFPGACDAFGDVYGRLVGLNLMRGFRREVRERVGGAEGCTHITELAQILPTAVVQAFAGDVIDTQGEGGAEPPFQIDRCRALRAEGEAVRLYFPRWHRPAAEPAAAASRANERVQTS
jgi:hypothetical protein